jgi:hypothetical protein
MTLGESMRASVTTPHDARRFELAAKESTGPQECLVRVMAPQE